MVGREGTGLGLREGLVVADLKKESVGFERDLQREAIRKSTAVNGREDICEGKGLD